MSNFLSRLNSPVMVATIECQHLIYEETHRFWDRIGARCMNFPLTTGCVSSPMGLGSDSVPVQINLFGVPTYLADSMQFALELGCRIATEGQDCTMKGAFYGRFRCGTAFKVS